MSLKSELDKTASNLRTIRKAILGRGSEISATAGLKDLPNAIFNIPADASLAFQTDEDIAYRKIVPEGAEEYAQITRIGGMTYKSKNIVPSPYANGTQTQNGITWTPNVNGSITANGTQIAASSYVIASFTEPLLLNGTYSASIGSTLPSSCSFYLTFNDGLGNVEIIASSASSGKKTITNRYCTSIRFWVKKDAVFNNVTFYPMLNLGSTAEPFEVQYKGLRDTAVTALESMSANDVATVGYLDIPEAVQSLEGYGRGVNADYYNYVEWRNRRAYFVQNTYRKVFDGTEELTCNTVNSGLYRYRHALTTPKAMTGAGSVIVRCTHYREGSVYDTYDQKYDVLGANEAAIFFTDTSVQTGSVADMQAKLKAWYDEGDPLTVEYILAEPIETDITHLMQDNFIKVEGGGEIEFENEYNYDAPSTINYIKKVGG